ncbi:RICIN domain-containing protein [Kitasatospora mediocidica]|uniref:RICIN domain-containing protein n=1 Tax=Kitasatospora mediocidica TaxID=58352 RepID=UPI0006915FEB|nr:RICIN domain-containing protein [Kitasatospora mediocidica]
MAFKARIVSAVFATALGASLALTAGVPTASAAAGDSFHPALPDVIALESAASPHCLEAAGWRVDNGAPAQQWDCTGGANQKWSLVAGAAGSIVNVNSGKCLEIANWSNQDGAAAQQWDCTGGWNQKWYWTHIPGTGYTLRNAFSGKCLEIALGDNSNGAVGRQWDCWAGNNQIWYPMATN